MYENQILEKLKNTLVLSVFKSFWASKESEIFPNRIYTKTIFPGPGRLGTSRNPVNNFTVALQGFRYYLNYRPILIIIGSSARVSRPNVRIALCLLSQASENSPWTGKSGRTHDDYVS